MPKVVFGGKWGEGVVKGVEIEKKGQFVDP